MIKVDEIINEIEELVDTSVSVPMTGTVVIKSAEIKELLKELKTCLPDEIKQARWIQNERDRILNEAREKYETVISEAKNEAERLVQRDKILAEARQRKEEMDRITKSNIKKLKLGTYDYIDSALCKFQDQMEELSRMYTDMFTTLEDTFGKVEEVIRANRDEIKDMAHYVKQEGNDN